MTSQERPLQRSLLNSATRGVASTPDMHISHLIA